jgi:hypothetical protein
MGRVKCDHIKRLITLTSDNIKRLSLYLVLWNENNKIKFFSLKIFLVSSSRLAANLFLKPSRKEVENH